MKKLLLLLGFSTILLGFIRFRLHPGKPPAVRDRGKSESLGCAPGSGGITEAGADGKFITVLPGWGNHHYAISTKNDSAQDYFDQGLNMYFGYHAREAKASFKEAARLDPASAMAYWGLALAMGPNYNSASSYKMPGEIAAVLEHMHQAGKAATPKEKSLMAAMDLRYSADSTDSQRPALNKAYADGLKTLIIQYPDDPEIKVFYVDAVMLIHPWDFWNNNGAAKPWTREIVDLCKTVLRENPKHPAALHYYIHVTEASRHPEVALGAADILKDLLPGVAHMVHMSSHEYERNGFYAEGVAVNDKADENLIRYDSLARQLNLSTHVPHYYAVQAYCGLSGGMYKKGIADAFRCRRSVSPTYQNTYQQYLYMMPAFARVRLGKWTEILQDTSKPDAHWSFASLLNDFAIGMAFVNTGHPDSAAGRLLLLQDKCKDSILRVADTLTNTALQTARVAEEILCASIRFARKNYASAIIHIKKAIQSEDSLIYVEPKDWMIPGRQYLGAFYLKMGKPALAEKVYREDLSWNPGNGWSLLGLYQSLLAQGKKNQLAGLKARYLRSFSQAESIPPASVYLN